MLELGEYIDRKLVHEIHTSGRKSFRTCRRSWDWVFNKQYYPITTAKPLEFGSAYHKAMEVYYDPKTWGWDAELRQASAIAAFEEMCEKQKAKALIESMSLDADVEADYNDRVDLGVGMLRYYFSDVAPVVDKGWKPIYVEVGFMVPIPNPYTGEEAIWCKCDQCWGRWHTQNSGWHPGMEIPEYDPVDRANFKGLPVVYAGRIDMMAEDEQGNYYLFDWKTAARLMENHEYLYLDDQIASYCWAMWILGIDVKGFIYHEQRKAYPIPPKKNKQQRLGCWYSVSKSEPYEYELYKKTVEEGDPQAYAQGLYNDMLMHLQSANARFHNRFRVIKSPDEFAEIGRNIGLEALEMTDPNLALYPSPGTFKCSFCSFQTPCMEKNTGGDYQYALDTMFEQREAYYVRNEPSTDKVDR